MHLSSYQQMGYFVNKYLDQTKELNILDVGSYDMNGSYKNYFQNLLWHYEGCDVINGLNVDFVMNQYEIPKDDETYNVVISGQTMEHVEYFWVWIKELARVLKKDGLLCLIAPGSGEIHPTPVDCWRFKNDGMIALAKWTGLQVLDVHTNNSEWNDCILIARKI